MMMNLYHGNKSRVRLWPALVAVGIVVAFTFGIDYASHGFVRAYVRSVSAVIVGSIPASDRIIDVVASRRSLQKENQELKDELVRRSEQMEYIDTIIRENETLHEMTRLAETEKMGLAVRVVSSLSASPYGTFVIGAGKDSGIGVGSVVLSAGGFVLGVVSDAGKDTAAVRALFAPDENVELVIGKTAFVAEGRGGGNARARVPRDAPIQVGDTAVAPRFGRPAGTILHIESASSSAESTLHLRLPSNADTLLFVYVLPL